MYSFISNDFPGERFVGDKFPRLVIFKVPTYVMENCHQALKRTSKSIILPGGGALVQKDALENGKDIQNRPYSWMSGFIIFDPISTIFHNKQTLY